jgi:hypothetical protein
LKISEKNKKQLGLNKGEIFKLRKRRLLKEQNALNEKLKMINFQLDQLFLRIKNSCYNLNDFLHLQTNLKKLARNSQLQSDNNRRKKLEKLINTKKVNFNKILVHIRTEVEIPDEVIDLLSLGKNLGIGNYTDS